METRVHGCSWLLRNSFVPQGGMRQCRETLLVVMDRLLVILVALFLDGASGSGHSN